MFVVFLLRAMGMPVGLYVCSVPFACHGHASRPICL